MKVEALVINQEIRIKVKKSLGGLKLIKIF